MIGSLSQLIREAELDAIDNGIERIGDRLRSGSHAYIVRYEDSRQQERIRRFSDRSTASDLWSQYAEHVG